MGTHLLASGQFLERFLNTRAAEKRMFLVRHNVCDVFSETQCVCTKGGERRVKV